MRALLTCLPLLFLGCGSRVLDTGETPDATTDATTDAPSTDAPPSETTDAGGFGACTGPGQCTVVPQSCCGSCGAATSTDMIGVATDRASAYRSFVCEGAGCPTCYREQDPFLQAFCKAGACTAVDLHESPLTDCTADSDCRLRYAPCCEPCGAPTSPLIALPVSQLSAYRALVCAPDTACPKCATSYPPSAKAVCNKGHCDVSM